MALAALALAAAGCGGKASSVRLDPDAFKWLRPAPAPADWPVATIPTGAAMAFPPGWRRIKGDAGTATAVELDSQHRFLGYLNITPRQGGERQGNWGTFRVKHNGDEGDRGVKLLAAATGLRFRTGRGSCVRDSYTTAAGFKYIETACLVAGRRGETVIVGAAPPRVWAQTGALIERAISALTT